MRFRRIPVRLSVRRFVPTFTTIGASSCAVILSRRCMLVHSPIRSTTGPISPTTDTPDIETGHRRIVVPECGMHKDFDPVHPGFTFPVEIELPRRCGRAPAGSPFTVTRAEETRSPRSSVHLVCSGLRRRQRDLPLRTTSHRNTY